MIFEVWDTANGSADDAGEIEAGSSADAAVEWCEQRSARDPAFTSEADGMRISAREKGSDAVAMLVVDVEMVAYFSVREEGRR